jgi:thiosulfate/3-mercaptopyruvate sulfurtransferase
MLMSVDDLYSIITDKEGSESILIIDTRSWHDYIQGHIPYAINLDVFAFHWADTSEEGIDEFNKHLTMLLKSIGVTYDRKVILYDDISGTLSSRGLWLMHYIAHNDAYILDGGFNEWRSKGYRIEYNANRAKPLHNYDYNINKDVLADYKYVLARLDDKDTVIIDARSRQEYDGLYVRAARGGHIPRALNIDWESNLTIDGRFKGIDDLKYVYPFDKSREVICYCQGGYRAAHTYVALRLLGFKKVKVYLGSWYEWGNRYDLPVEY